MFGRNIGGELGVTEEQWSDFVASEITPRFPGGLTVDDAMGQWRDTETGKVVKEPSKELQVIVPADAEKDIKENLTDGLSLAAFNGPALSVVSGPFSAVEKYEEKLSNLNIAHHRIHTSHAFHSPMMDPILTEFTEQVKKVNLKSPRIPFISNVRKKR